MAVRSIYSRPITRPYGKFKTVVTPDLALTPSKMYECMQRGIPISATADPGLTDGVENPSWNVDLRRRSVDPADLFMQQNAARAKIAAAMSNAQNNNV